MVKYSFKFKKNIVEEYLAGKGGARYLADKYDIPAETNVRKWINNYQDLALEERISNPTQIVKWVNDFRIAGLML